MSIQKLSLFFRETIRFIICVLILVFPNSSYACTQAAFGGTIAQLQHNIQSDFWTAKEIAWASGKLSRQEAQALVLRNAPINHRNVRNIWIRGTDVYLTDFFLRAIVHQAVFTAFSRHDPSRFHKPNDVIRFRREIYENAGRGIPIDYYPYFLGLTFEECVKISQEAGEISYFNAMTPFATMPMMFWFLHEIGHSKLEHQVNVSTTDSWKQEYDADQWALEVMSEYFDTEVFIFFAGAIVETLSMFSNNRPDQELMATVTHPPITCRKLAAIKFVEEFLANDPEIEPVHQQTIASEMALLKITKTYYETLNGKGSGTERCVF